MKRRTLLKGMASLIALTQVPASILAAGSTSQASLTKSHNNKIYAMAKNKLIENQTFFCEDGLVFDSPEFSGLIIRNCSFVMKSAPEAYLTINTDACKYMIVENSKFMTFKGYLGKKDLSDKSIGLKIISSEFIRL